MNLIDMRTIVRHALHDEDATNYRWTNDELDRHIAHAVKDFSEAAPYAQKATKATTPSSRVLDIATITSRVMVEAVEYPVDKSPKRYQRFSLWRDILTLLGDEVPDGSNAYIYYGKLHILDASTSTLPAKFENLVAIGASGYAAMEWATYATNRVNAGDGATSSFVAALGALKLADFRRELRQLGGRNRLRVRALYKPYYPIIERK